MYGGHLVSSEKVLVQQEESVNIPENMTSKDILSLADTARSEERAPHTLDSSVMHKKSKITLASSNSANTLKRIAKRYKREQRIVVFEDGVELSDQSPCFTFELNQLM